MTVATDYPGVYVEESAELSLSVSSGATAVPVFVSGTDSFKNTKKINSWLDFIDSVKSFDPAHDLHLSIRSYFDNGGGPCYIVHKANLMKDVPKLDDATLLVAAGEDIKEQVAQLCQQGNGLFAILDGPKDELKPDSSRDNYEQNSNAAVYYPYLIADWATTTTCIPPSAAIAGVYCSVDRSRGVWKAPANVVLQGGVKPKYKVTDDLQATYNSGKAINMIREFPDTGTTVWGARTLDDSDKWRYIPVRRLFNSVERDIKNAMSFAMFEPNSQPTWERVRSAVNNYLYSLWQQGGLAGTKQDEAYFVQIGQGVTMTDDDIKQGKMIIKVGLAAVRPAEFIILQFSQSVGEA
ncbi:phage tail sheath family protein [Pseudomonas chlororaphis]|uniref:Phage tail sheath protein n=1 Tax=Pseudomonas chlororaphis TaxID=587753 RepID=A0AAX3FQ05_9PSED|nr:phage tail sheath C-terminal domain-containing protein [Pseudomonas chlororaphis]AZC38232.1 Phage tail sheath protein FI [Pseudomonas chlororaphis subsp. piscium]AZC44781.1 Phage tail sheath protein FI [Pseudomonas chlororaphis subsp. piscium]WDG70386.1 phage tail sheath C-terminal domain-containing protein [Pseudomonas chlororaphis]WDH31827.1 phage tail sheath C-terminal domain-containing protein [Pseudomonas chlororaphis]WDH68912.1 phage tail sheath C-terminal domain-containing protein [P